MWRQAALIGAVFALVTWMAYCLVVQPPRIEGALRHETERVLTEASLGDVRATVDGRDVVLDGQVATPALLAEAERLLARVVGIRGVDNRLTVHVAPEAPAPTYLEIRVGVDGVSLRGAVPNGELLQAVVDSARQTFGDRVDQRLAIDAAVPTGAAVAAAASVVRALARSPDGVRVRLKGDSLRLSGTVASVEERRRVEDLARAATPGVRLFFSALRVGGS